MDSGSPPDVAYSLPTRPSWHKGDVFSLIRLVIAYRGLWEIYLDPDGIWIAQGATDSNKWARFEADTAAHLEGLIKPV